MPEVRRLHPRGRRVDAGPLFGRLLLRLGDTRLTVVVEVPAQTDLERVQLRDLGPQGGDRAADGVDLATDSFPGPVVRRGRLHVEERLAGGHRVADGRRRPLDHAWLTDSNGHQGGRDRGPDAGAKEDRRGHEPPGLRQHCARR